MRRRGRILLLLGCLLALWGAPAAQASAGTAATTGGATSVTTSTVELNGVVDPSYPDAAWFFEYSRTRTFDTGTRWTRLNPVGAGFHAVAVSVSRLAAGTTYYYRVGVVWTADTTLGSTLRLGATHAFRTLTRAQAARYGTVRLLSQTFGVRGGAAAVPLGCRGARHARCAGRVTVALHTGTPCGSARFLARAPQTRTVRIHLAGDCRARVNSVPRHRLAALAWGVFTGHQTPFTRAVTLAG